MIFERVRLGEICEFLDSRRVPVTESDRKPGPYPYYGANGQQGWIDGYLFDEPLLLLAEDGGNFGSKTRPIAYRVSGKCWVNNHAHVLRPKAGCDLGFLQRVLSFYDVMPFVSGTTRLKLTKGSAEELPILLPPLLEQQRIAAILERADRLRRLRRYALELSVGYLQAVFVEMFGDPVKNPKGWQRAKVAELGDVQTGNTPSREQPEYYGSYIEWIKSDNILDDQMFVSQSREMLSLDGLKQGRAVDAGALLVTCIAGSLSSVGGVALTNRRVAFNQQINAVTPDRDVNSLFFYGLFRMAQPFVQQNASAGMKHIITKSKLEELTLIKPPLSLQARFGQVAQRRERLRAQQREALRQAEQLFGALLGQAFRGEL